MARPTSTERGAEVRQRLLAAAAQLIPELGWHAVSTRAVAQRAGVAPGLVHYHFTSVQALMRQAAVVAMRQVLSAIPPVLSTAESADAGLGAMLASLDDYSGTDPMSLLFAEAYLAATRDGELRAELSRLLDDVRGVLASWLAAKGAKAPADTAAVLVAAVDGVLLHRALHAGLTSAAVTPVLLRLLGDPEENADGKGTE